MMATRMEAQSAAPSGLPEVEGVSHRWLDVGGLRMHLAEAGPPDDSPPILLLHGWPQHWYEWRHLIPRLAGERRLLMPDLRGLGWTDAPPSGYLKEEMAEDVVRLLDALELDRVDLIGHDWGGYIGFLLGILHPARVRRYIALNIIHPWIRGPRSGPELLRRWTEIPRLAYQLPIITPGLNQRVLNHPAFMPRFLKGTAVHRNAWTEKDVEAFRAPLRDAARIRASAAIYRTFLTQEIVPLIRGRYRDHRLRAPTLLLFGLKELVMTPEQLRGFEPYADDMRLELVEDSGHFIAEEKPGLIADRARELFV
jgi:pimeloyl-ACP methyl ester carboxylesterase